MTIRLDLGSDPSEEALRLEYERLSAKRVKKKKSKRVKGIGRPVKEKKKEKEVISI